MFSASDLDKAKARFADNLTPKHAQTNIWTWNISQGLVHLTKALEEIEDRQVAILKALQSSK